MSFPVQTPVADPTTLRAAQVAVERGHLQRADALFLKHLAQTGDDPIGLGEYGLFCLRTDRAATARYLLYKANALRPGDSELLSHFGYAQLDLQEFEPARRSFEAALEIDPGHPIANYGLAMCLQNAGAWAAAATCFGNALSPRTDAFPILLNLADACHRAGDAAQARIHFENARQIAPDAPPMLLEYGKFLREQGEAAQAMQWIDRCARQLPDEPKVILEQARCLRALGDLTQAMGLLARLEKLSPGLPDCYAEYGECLQAPTDIALRELHWVGAIHTWIKKGEFVLADSLIDRLLNTNPASAVGWNMRGILENARQRRDVAEAAWSKAVEIDPAGLDAAANLTWLYESTNRVAQAKSTADNAMGFIHAGKQQNGAIELHLALCKIARRAKDHAEGFRHLDQIEALGPSDMHRKHANFERGKLMDLRGDAAEAIAAFERGNAIALAAWRPENPGRNKALTGVEYMLDLVGKGWLRQWKPDGAMPTTAKLAFLVGFPRSGTTLLNHVFDGHSAIQTLEEKPPVQQMVDAVNSMPKRYPHAIADFDALDVAYLRDVYLRSAAEHGAGASMTLILDKYPMHDTYAPLLHRVFPQARYVFALRHPCDVVLSCFMQSFQLNDWMANFCTLADTVAMYTRTMDLWQAYREQLPLVVHTVRYEDIVDDFDNSVRALCGFLDVPWEDSLGQFADRAQDRGLINTASYDQVSVPIYRASRYRWERYREHLAPYLPALQPYIERFGYA